MCIRDRRCPPLAENPKRNAAPALAPLCACMSHAASSLTMHPQADMAASRGQIAHWLQRCAR
eukprot:5873128-Pyramimonas_sp.AAC.1